MKNANPQPTAKPRTTAQRREQAKQFQPLPELTDDQRARFYSLLAEPDANGCRLWKGGRTRGGYGAFIVNGRHYYAHRLAAYLATGSDPGERLALHSCDVRACCAGDHLRAGTYRENMTDAIERGRWKPPQRKAVRADGQANRRNPNAPDGVPMTRQSTAPGNR